MENKNPRKLTGIIISIDRAKDHVLIDTGGDKIKTQLSKLGFDAELNDTIKFDLVRTANNYEGRNFEKVP